MKKILILIATFFSMSLQVWAQDCDDSLIAIISQSDVDNFATNYPNCTELEGALLIEGPEITSLAGLSQLTRINALAIESTSLVNLSGLENLESVDILQLQLNTMLEDISAFNNITTLITLWIVDNSVLTNLDGFQSMEEINSITIRDNGVITDLTPFESLVSVNSLAIQGGVQSINGLQGVTEANDITISSNEEMTNLQGLNNISQINRLVIANNDNLASLDGLNSLESANYIQIQLNPNLASFQGFSNLTTVNEDFQISSTVLLNLAGLENLSYTKTLKLIGNDAMTSLNGLENLQKIDSLLRITNNDPLTDLSAISTLNFADDLEALWITNNSILAACNLPNICDYLLNGGDAIISGNNINCKSVGDVIDACISSDDHTSLIGNVWADMNTDCMSNAGDEGVTNALLELTAENYGYTFSTDAEGNYDVSVLDGDHTLKIINPSVYWNPCFVDTMLITSGLNDTITTDFYLTPQGDCSFVDWDLHLNGLRICGTRTATLDFCNLGVQPAENIIFTLDLGEFVTLDSASMDYTTDVDGNIQFVLDDLSLFECGAIELSLFTDCDSVVIEDVLCIDVTLIGDELCETDTQWDGSTTEVTGYCEGDSIYFQLENIGFGNMQTPAQFRVEILIEDIVMLFIDGNYELDSGESTTFAYPLIGSGFHFSANQSVGHPIATDATATVPNCQNSMDNLIFNFFPNYNGDPFSNSFCTVAVNSFDPNDKSALPIGTGDEHFIEDDWELNYTIRFQNTGNDVAFDVVIRDLISEDLDLSTLKVRGATHDFTWDLTPGRELVFTFENILLPDSTTNEPASHGQVSYSITPKKDLTPLTRIENTAGIYFDFNDPIITNTVFHTIRKPVVSNIDYTQWCHGALLDGVAITQDTFWTDITAFVEYDSVQITFLQVVDTLNITTMVDVVIGETFEDVLINGDTTFVVTGVSEFGCDSIVTYQVNATTSSVEQYNPLQTANIFPNPASTELFIDASNIAYAQRWTLMNTLGLVVWEQHMPAFEGMNRVDLKQLPAGLYLLEGETLYGRKVWKIIVE